MQQEHAKTEYSKLRFVRVVWDLHLRHSVYFATCHVYDSKTVYKANLVKPHLGACPLMNIILNNPGQGGNMDDCLAMYRQKMLRMLLSGSFIIFSQPELTENVTEFFQLL